MDWSNINTDKDTSGLGPIEYDQSKVPQLIRKHADNVRGKSYGQEIREAQARNAEYAGLIASEAVDISNETKGRQDTVETQFNSVQQELTDKDPISAPEIIAARGGESTLSDRLDKEHQNVTAQLAQTMNYLNDFGINVKANGAIGDGVTDDLPAFEACVNSLPLSGGTIYIPDGNYYISNSWMIRRDDVTVICSDKAVITLVLPPEATSSRAGAAVNFTGGQIGDTNLYAHHINNCTWIGGTINTPQPLDGTPNNENALGFLRCNNIKVRDLKVERCGRKAVTAQYNCDGVDIQNIKIGVVNWSGVNVEVGSKNIKIKDISINYSHKDGIGVSSDSTSPKQTDIEIENIDCLYIKSRSVVFDYFTDAYLSNVNIKKGDWHGIYATHGDNLVLNNIKMSEIGQNSLRIISIEKTLKIYDVHSVNQRLESTGIDCFYITSCNATIEHRNNKIKADTPTYRYALNTENSPNFISSFGCFYQKGTEDDNKYAGWNPKNANDIFGGNSLIIQDGYYVGYGGTPPDTGRYSQGDRVYRQPPQVGQPKSWVCTVSGTPGTWVSEGVL